VPDITAVNAQDTNENCNLNNSISLYCTNEISQNIHTKKQKNINATDMDDAEGKLDTPLRSVPVVTAT